MRTLIRNPLWKHLFVLVPVLAGFFFFAPVVESSDEYAIHARLAVKSLLLDGCMAGDRIVAVGERGHILLSDDQGKSWRQAAQVPTQATLTGVYFTDKNAGCAVGHDAVILRTRDNGENWSLVHFAPEEERPLLDVFFPDHDIGFAIGAYGFFLVTHDSGKTWASKTISEDDYHLNKIVESNDGTLYLAGESGRIYVSEDRGNTWQEEMSPYSGTFFGVLPLNDNSLLVFGLQGNLFQYDNHKRLWKKLVSSTKVMLTDGLVMDNSSIVIVGLSGTMLMSDGPGNPFIAKKVGRLGISSIVQTLDNALILIGDDGARRFDLSK